MKSERIPNLSEINFKYPLADFLADLEFYHQQIKSKLPGLMTKALLISGLFSSNEDDQSLRAKCYFNDKYGLKSKSLRWRMRIILRFLNDNYHILMKNELIADGDTGMMLDGEFISYLLEYQLTPEIKNIPPTVIADFLTAIELDE